jgi:hypothetical protein
MYDQPNLAFIKCFTHFNVLLNELVNNSRTMCLKKPWMMGWTMGPNKTYLDALMFCNKNKNSPLNFHLHSSIATCSCHFTKIIHLFIEI